MGFVTAWHERNLAQKKNAEVCFKYIYIYSFLVDTQKKLCDDLTAKLTFCAYLR